MESRICPSRETLQAFYQGQLGEPPIEAVAAHLDECEACQSTVDKLADAPDTLAVELRRLVIPDPFLAEAECDLAIQRFQQISGPQSGDEQTRRPSNQPGPGTGVGIERPIGSLTSVQVGQYQLHEKLGSGGMGTVYKAVHTRLKRVVALKVIAAERMGDSAAITRFNREMEAVGRLRHPNIVEAYDAGEVNGSHFLVMEFVDGFDLATFQERCGPLPIADACELVRQAATGLQHAHEHGLVHRDIKPSNLIVEYGWRAKPDSPHNADNAVPRLKILDLGLARLH